jgi:hypothetical protein
MHISFFLIIIFFFFLMAAVPLPVFPNTVGMTFQDFYETAVVRDQPNVTIDWLRQQGLLARHMNCPRCFNVLFERRLRRSSANRCWRCLNRGCRIYLSIRQGSFFQKNNLDLETILSVIYMWALNSSGGRSRRKPESAIRL